MAVSPGRLSSLRIGVGQGLSELRSNLRRSILSIASIAMGVFAVMVVNSLTRGNREETLRGISRMGGVEIMSIEARPPRNRLQEIRSGRSPGLTYPQIRAAADSIPEIDFLLPQAWLPNRTVAIGNGTRPADIVSVAWEHFAQFGFSLESAQDSLGLSADWRRGDGICLLGAGLADGIPGSGNPQRDVVRFGGLRLRVAGVVKPRDRWDGGQRTIYLPWSLYSKSIGGPNASLDGIRMKVRSAGMIPSAAEKLEALLVRQHRGTRDFSIRSPAGEIAARKRANRALTLAGTFVALLALTVGGIGVLNLMWSTANNRIREIGLRKALGASNGGILIQFLAEAVTVSASGTAIGLVLGSFPLLLPEGSLPVTPHQTPLDFLVCGGVGTALGLLAGIYPAVLASRFSPVEALAHA